MNNFVRSRTTPLRAAAGFVFLLSVAALAQDARAQAGRAGQRVSDDPIARLQPDHVRVMAFNVAVNSIFPEPGLNGPERPWRAPALARVLAAIDADVLCVQEILAPRTAADLGVLLDSIRPLGGERRWYVHGVRDNVIASRWPLSNAAAFVADFGTRGLRGHAMALVDLPDDHYDRDLYVVCAHLPSRGSEADVRSRERHADAITRWIRDVRTADEGRPLAPGTPIVVAGDLNVYADGPTRHLDALLHGRLLHGGLDTVPQPPDWDGSPLRDAEPLHNGRGPERYTWRNDLLPNPPGALDRVLYTGSVLEPHRRFVLNTQSLTEAERAPYGLRPDDTVLDPVTGHMDHLPVVVDFSVRPDSTALTKNPQR